MTELSSYGKIYNLGHKDIQDLFNGEVSIEEKVDGSQVSFAMINGELKIRSKSCTIHHEHPNNMFAAGAFAILDIQTLLHPNWVYRGEYLQKPKHNMLNYDRIPKNHIVIFDIDAGLEHYLTHEEKKAEAERLGFECVPLLARGEFTEYETLKALFETISFLGGQTIEGIVIKNYNRFTSSGKAMMGKYVSEKFKEVHKRDWIKDSAANKEIKLSIGQSLNTEARFHKAIIHVKEAGLLTDSPKDIGPLMRELIQDIETEERAAISRTLYEWARKDIIRIATKGFPEWYKELLAKKQFEEYERYERDASQQVREAEEKTKPQTNN